MPKLKSLHLGWTSQGFVRTKDTGYYPDAVISDITKKFAIEDAEAQWDLKQRLETAGTMYLSSKHNTAGPLPRHIQSYFQAIIARSRDLIELIEKADDRSWQYIWRTEQKLQWDALHKNDSRLADIGILRWGDESDPENLIAEYSDLNDALKHVRYLELLAKECSVQVPSGERGRKKNESLSMWVSDMARFWEQNLGRKFTVTYHKNAPISEAGQFLEACLTPMDPDAKGQLVSQMRQVGVNRKNRAKKNNNS